MPSLNQVRTKVNDWLSNRWPALVNFQENYFTNHGRYWQGLATHSSYPAFTNSTDGDSVPDRLAIKASDVAETWLDNFSNWGGVELPCQFIIDVYDGPDGKGWVGKVRVSFNGTIYERAQNVGPEEHRTFAWRVYTPPVDP
jgi:hypothetical protein